MKNRGKEETRNKKKNRNWGFANTQKQPKRLCPRQNIPFTAQDPQEIDRRGSGRRRETRFW